jgi:ribosomal protein L21
MLIMLDKKRIQDLVSLTEGASKDPTRPFLNQVNIKNGKAVATDGFIMAWVDDAVYTGVEFAISCETIKAFKKDVTLTVDTEVKTVSNGTVTAKINEYYKGLDIHLPKFERHEESHKAVTGEVIDNCIRFNPELLTRLSKAIGVKRGHGIMLVKGGNEVPLNIYYLNEWRGVIMPMRK